MPQLRKFWTKFVNLFGLKWVTSPNVAVVFVLLFGVMPCQRMQSLSCEGLYFLGYGIYGYLRTARFLMNTAHHFISCGKGHLSRKSCGLKHMDTFITLVFLHIYFYFGFHDYLRRDPYPPVLACLISLSFLIHLLLSNTMFNILCLQRNTFDIYAFFQVCSFLSSGLGGKWRFMVFLRNHLVSLVFKPLWWLLRKRVLLRYTR